MRTLPTLGVCGWLVAATALPALSAIEWVAGGVAQAQQFSPPDRGALNLLLDPSLDLFQKELLFRGHEGLGGGIKRPTPLASSPPTSDWLNSNSLWLSSVTDSLNTHWAEQARDWQRQRSLFFSIGNLQGSSPGKGDYWKPGEFDRLIGR